MMEIDSENQTKDQIKLENTVNNSSSNSNSSSPDEFTNNGAGIDDNLSKVPIPKKSAIIKTDKPRPHVCPTCTRGFARLEHLKRHERSHTNEKPFQCAACGRCFARRDLVLRHQQKLHSSLPTNNRSKIPRKSLKLAMNTGKEGEIVSDYLNDNINIIRNNKNSTLPLPSKKNEINQDINNNNNLKSNLSSSSILTSSTASPNHNSSLPIDRSASVNSTVSSNQIYASPHSINSNSPNYVSPHNYNSRSGSIVDKKDKNQMKQQTKQFINTQPLSQQQQQINNANDIDDHEIDDEDDDDEQKLRLHEMNAPQQLFSSDLGTSGGSQFPPATEQETSYRNNRHASFSAATSKSYTGFESNNPESVSNDSAAPPIVSFSSPQLKHEENGDFVYEDLDLDMDWQQLQELGIHVDFNFNNNNNNNKSKMPTNQNNTANAFEVPTLFKSNAKGNTTAPNTNAAIAVSPSLSSPTGIATPAIIQQQVGINKFSIPTSLSQGSNSPINHKIHPDVKSSSASNTPAIPGSISGSNPGSVAGSGSGSSELNSAPPTTTTTPVGVSVAHPLVAPSSIQVSPANASSKTSSTSTTNTTNTTTTSPNNNALDPSTYKRPNLHSFDSNEDWLTEFINAPIETEFPTVSNHIGFTDSPVDETNEALGEFTSRSTSNPMSLHYNQNKNNSNYVPYNTHDPNHNGYPNNNHLHQNHPNVHPYPAQNIHPQQQQQHLNFGGSQQFQPNGSTVNTPQTHQYNPSNSRSQASSTNDLSQFFRSRQMDLYKHISFDDSNSRVNIPGRCTDKIRNHIMETYHLKESQFPLLHDLNHYLQLYEIEFNKYFPFIHIPSLNVDDNLDQIPLLLSMSAIGALYSFHARNSSTLFNFSRFLIHNYMENQMSNNLANVTDVPLHITQSLLLHMFLGMFHNDIEVTKLTQRQLASLVALVKSTNLDKPLDSFIMPPAINETLNLESENLKACHDYFIFAQSRIRTIHCLHYLCVLFGVIVDIPILLNADEIKCGNIIYKESIWKCKNATEWIDVLNSEKVQINSKLTLIQLSNGNLSYITLWNDLYNHTLNSKENIGFRSLLSLLLSLNGLVHQTRLSLEDSSQSIGSKVAKWRMDLRPNIEELMKTWESCFIKNGGIVVPKGQNLHLINSNPVLKLILPLLSFAKITKCVYISPLLQKVWSRDWNGMNQEMKILDSDPEALRESISHCLDIINLWIDTISIVSDAEKTSVRTPIFFLTCLFASSLIISEYLYATENWAQNYLKNQNQNNSNLLTTADRVLWLRTETILKKVEKNLLPQGSNNSSYSEFLRIQAKGALDVEILDDEIARLALEPGDFTPIAQIITKGRLSNRCLSLGVRMLADAPVWPIALVFAEALKIRATEIHATQNKFA